MASPFAVPVPVYVPVAFLLNISYPDPVTVIVPIPTTVPVLFL